MSKINQNTNFLFKLLSFIERVGNALPHTAVLFGIFALLVLFFSWLGSILNFNAIHPTTNETINTINLISQEGLHRILLEMVNNYTSFAPLGIVMVALLGIGVAESSGLISALIRLLVLKAPSSLLTFIIVFVGIISNVASDLGYVFIIPLAGVIFHSVGRHPIVGMSAAFAGVSGGFSANILIGTIDPLLAGLSTEAARIIDANYIVLPTANYYFMSVSTFFIALAGTWVTNKIIEPRMGKYSGNVVPETLDKLTAVEKKGIFYSFIVFCFWFIIFLIGIIPDNGFLRGSNNSVLHSPLLKGFIAILFIMAASIGITYGFITKNFKTNADVIKGMTDNLKTLAPFLVLVFFASQFVAWFKWSNIGLILAIKGANFLQNVDLGIIPILILFVLFSGFINLFMGSASAKWAIMAPVFIPMFMLLGYSPELSQAVFRIGDSVTNIVSPMMSFFALIIAYYQKYDHKAGIGTLISIMLPYTFVFMFLWTLLLVIWILLDLPLGPGVEIYYNIHVK